MASKSETNKSEGGYTDEPVAVEDWAPEGKERPYDEAITPEHRAWLAGRHG